MTTNKFLPKIHILATCRKPELLRYTTLVFDSLRTGFPTAEVYVYLNNIADNECEKSIRKAALESKCLTRYRDTIHHEWINELITSNHEPFIICDTDMVFWSNMEDAFSALMMSSDYAIAGRLIPEFQDEFSGCLTQPRIHTSLMYINPKLLKEESDRNLKGCIVSEFIPFHPVCYPLVIPRDAKNIFFDTCAFLYEMLPKQKVYSFGCKELDCYDHFNFGTISDIVLPRLNDGIAWKEAREEALKNPLLMKGCWKQQDEYYKQRAAKSNQLQKEEFRIPKSFDERMKKEGYEKVYDKRENELKKQGEELREELCLQNKEAEEFCNLWYSYIHAIDDLVDESKDPLSVPYQAALFYKSSFYRQNESLLFPIVLSITAQYELSVRWEKQIVKKDEYTPKELIMADVLRMAGNQMFGMVALILGGREHQNNMLAKIYLADWKGQH